ncbi:RHS repeat domain-containing protein [Haloferula sargassicola]|uniref:YD repeat-containing protein n=1 Tax=Haloferula sargassicola TaxID=490096 RepID=A0ABP9UUY9_9BACT
MIHPDNTRTLTTIEGNLRASVATLDSTGSEIHSTSYLYDALRRPIAMTDSRTGTVSFTQTSGGVPVAHDDPNALPAYTESGNLLCQRDSGGRATRYAYDVMGRRVSVDAPDTTLAGGATSANVTRTSYHPTGEVKAEWGDQTYATYRLYDEQGRMTELRTYRSLAHGTEPTSASPGYDTTAWSYHPQRGFLTAKRDAAAKGADYTYTAGDGSKPQPGRRPRSRERSAAQDPRKDAKSTASAICSVHPARGPTLGVRPRPSNAP